MLDYLHNNKTLENIMRIVDHPTALRTATSIVSSMVCNACGKSKPKTFAVGDIVTFNGNPNNIFLIESVRIGVAQITYGGTWLQTTYGPNIFPEIYDWIGDSQWTKIDEKKVKKNT